MKYYGNLMDAMTNFFSAMSAEHDALIAESNAQAEEARSLIARVQTTISKHEELTSVMGMVSQKVEEKYCGMQSATSNIKEALVDLNESEIPMCAVEQFEGYCEKCGEELTAENPWAFGAGGAALCATCFEEETVEDEAEVGA